MAVPPPLPHHDKAAIRKMLRQRRVAFVADADATMLATHHAALGKHLAPVLQREGPIAGYVAHRGEPDVLFALLEAHDRGTIVALPHIGEGRMRFARWHPGAALVPTASGILQPEMTEELVPAIVLTPLVGFGRGGTRLGQGGGYYDRWFAAHPKAERIGIAWSVQEVAALPSDTWDMPLHAVVTEKEWFRS